MDVIMSQKAEKVDQFKLMPRVAKVLRDIAQLKGVQMQHVLDDYLELFENDLVRLLAKRTAELKKPKS